jgi:hypothetical protein
MMRASRCRRSLGGWVGAGADRRRPARIRGGIARRRDEAGSLLRADKLLKRAELHITAAVTVGKEEEPDNDWHHTGH